MDEDLKIAIDAYIETSQRMFKVIARHVGIELPITAFKWAMASVPGTGESKEGIKYRKHGFGIEMWSETERVDFDLGKNGELNGIDPWRLLYFCQDNGYNIKHNEVSDVQDEFKALSEKGELTYSGSILYYLPENT